MGSNQYRTRTNVGLSQDADLLSQAAQMRRCGEVWDTDCAILVGSPDYTHTEHGLNAPINQLIKLAHANDTPVNKLELLVHHPNPFVRSGVAENANVTAMILGELAQDPDPHVRVAVASNHATTSAILDSLAQQPVARKAVIDNPNTQSTTLQYLFDSIDDATQHHWIVQHPNCPPQVLERAVHTDDHWVIKGAVGHPACPVAALQHVLQNVDDTALVAAAIENPGCSTDMIDAALAAHPKLWGVHKTAALHHHTSPATLAMLANEPDSRIKQAVATNHHAPPEVLAGLALHEDRGVRMYVAGNPSTPPDTMARLAHDPEVVVRSALAANPQCPPEVVEQLLGDEDGDVRRQALENPNCPEEYRQLGRVAQ